MAAGIYCRLNVSSASSTAAARTKQKHTKQPNYLIGTSKIDNAKQAN